MISASFSADGRSLMLFFDLPDGSRANLCAQVDLDAYGGAVQTWRNGQCLARYDASDGIRAIRKALGCRQRNHICGTAPRARQAAA